MILTNGDEIRWTDVRHKCDSAIAEYMLACEGHRLFGDEDTGTVESSAGWTGRYGKRLMCEDDRGFITVERFSSEDDAINEMDRIRKEAAVNAAEWWVHDNVGGVKAMARAVLRGLDEGDPMTYDALNGADENTVIEACLAVLDEDNDDNEDIR